MVEQLRLFVALSLPAAVRASLFGWASGLGMDGLRVVPESSLHVTLAFLGSVASSSVPAVARTLVPWPGGTLAVTSPVWLPSARRPRVLAVGLEPPEAVVGVQASIARALVEAELYEPESRPFLPHVTVGRVRRGARVSRVVPSVAVEPFVPEGVVLYSSRPGPVYTVVARADGA